MSVAIAVHLITRPRGIGTINKTDKGESLGSAGLAVFSQEDTGYAAEALEQVAEFLLFCHFGDLTCVSILRIGKRNV